MFSLILVATASNTLFSTLKRVSVTNHGCLLYIVIVDRKLLGLDEGKGELGGGQGPGVFREEHELLRPVSCPVKEFVASVDGGVVEQEDGLVGVVGVAGSEQLEQLQKEENGPCSVVLLAVHSVVASAVAADA